MKRLKNILFILGALMVTINLTGCMEKNVKGSLEEIMDKIYVNIPEEERPMMLTNIEVTKENAEMYLGTSDIDFKEALASESATGSIPHSVVLIRVKENADVEAVKKKIEQNVNPRKWICVEAEEVEVESKGDLIILIMSSEKNAEKIENSFDNL